MKYTSGDITKLGTILSVSAHPDDESWTAGGVIAAALANGQRVVCVTATLGDAGKTADEARWPQVRLGAIRKAELAEALACLGGPEHHQLGYRDGTLKEIGQEKPIEEISDIIRDVKPDTILTFGPDGLTGHDDHITVYHWACEAVRRTGSKAAILTAVEPAETYETSGQVLQRVANIFWNVDRPVTVRVSQADYYFELPEEHLNKKLAALAAHACQLSSIFADPHAAAALRDHARHECFMLAEQPARSTLKQ